MEAAKYSIGLDFGSDPDPDYANLSPYWVICVIRQGTLLSYSRKLGKSIFNNLANDPVLNTTPPLVISDDCLSISISNNKRTPNPTFSATLKQSDTNYLIEIFPGDYLFCWIVYGEEKYLDLLDRINHIQPCNKFHDGLKFVGRVEDIRKKLVQEGNVGQRTFSYQLTAKGFAELHTYFFYDYSLASNDAQEQSLGAWMARLGVDFVRLFGDAAPNPKVNNINNIIPNLINLIIGSGPSKSGNIAIPGFGGESVSATPTLDSEAPYAYVIPVTVGKLLGKDIVQPGKPTSVLAYADILEVTMGVQKYSNKNGIKIFTPDLDDESTIRNKKTTIPLLGTFLPYMPEFTNVPLWDLLKRYLNPAINEIYATLRVNPDGDVVPSIICRQIPFTTEAFQDSTNTGFDGFSQLDDESGFDSQPLNVTKFLSLPRWLIPNSFITGLDVGMSNATRTNFVHIYGNAALLQNNVGQNEQIIVNPPIRDDLDIQRSGLYPSMQTVDCFVSDQVGRAPNQWMRLVADWSIGSQYTLNGTIQTFGIESPIPVGDNIELDGVVYHIEGVSHNCGMQGNNKFFRTNLLVDNGMRAVGTVDNLNQSEDLSNLTPEMPIYPAMAVNDNTNLNPGITYEGPRTTGAAPISLQVPAKQIFTPDPFKSSAVIDQELKDIL